jgi:signal transduction histidine kinase/CheY-like chemotaxis protein
MPLDDVTSTQLEPGSESTGWHTLMAVVRRPAWITHWLIIAVLIAVAWPLLPGWLITAWLAAEGLRTGWQARSEHQALTVRLLAQAAATKKEQQTSRDIQGAKDADKSTFLASMSHEIRTPLSGVIGMLRLLCDAELPQYQHDLATSASGSAETLLSVLDDVLDLSALEAGTLDVEIATLDPAQVVEEVTTLFAQDALERGLELACFVTQRFAHKVAADPVRLRQILTNLLSNALKFTEEGAVTARLYAPPGHAGVCIDIRDTGRGVSSDKIAELFDAFSSGKQDGSGRGLGLAISRRLAERMGGVIRVHSRVGQGSCFTLELPAAANDAMPLRDKGPSKLVTDALLISDRPLPSEVIEAACSDWGVALNVVTNITDAEAALAEARNAQRSFGAVIADQRISGDESLHFLDRLDRQLGGFRAYPVLLAPFGWSEERSPVPVAHILSEPITHASLRRALAKQSDERQPTVAPNDAQRSVTTGKILLAEDNPVSAKIGALMLSQMGHEVTVVGDGEAAIEQLRRQTFDLVLMDCEMPVLSGYEATQKLRRLERHTGAHVPVIALTAHTTEDAHAASLAAGMDDHLSKPISPEALTETLDRWLKVGADEEATPDGSNTGRS